VAREIGYPVLIKAASGGGGRGMQVVHSEHALLKGVHVTQREAQGAFGDETVYLEKYLERPRHVEIQSWRTPTGTSSIWATGTAHCSAVTRK